MNDEPVISGTTVTHPTDVMCWDDLPGGPCAMEFRPPSAMELRRNWQQGIADLTKVSLVIGAVFWMLRYVLLPQLSSWNRFAFMAIVFGAMFGIVTVLLKPGRNQQGKHTAIVAEVQFTIGIAFAAFFIVLIQPSRLASVLTYAVGGGVALGQLARQIVRHQVGWHSANPHVPDLQRQQWRAGSDNVINALNSNSVDLQNLAIEGMGGCAVACIALAIHPACYLFCDAVGVATWSWWVPPMTILTLFAYDHIWIRHSQSSNIFQTAMGHWFDYQRDVSSSPLLHQSRAGTATHRTVLTWATLGILVVGLAATISNASFLSAVTPSLGADRSDLAFVALIDTALAAVTAPWLLWFSIRIIASPTLVAAYLRHEVLINAHTNEFGSKEETV